MAILVLIDGEPVGRRYKISEPKAVLGRHPDCDIVLEVGAVSRQHAQITTADQEFLLEDLHSRNGTFVNGVAIQAPHTLQDGDEVKICDLSFAFYRNEPHPSTSFAPRSDDTAFSTVMVDDAEDNGSSQIMSKLDVTAGAGGIRLSVNPEFKLRAMLEITQNLSRAISVEAVLPKLLDSLFKIFVQADRGFIVMAGPNGQLAPKVVRHRRPDSEETVRISRTIVNQVMQSKQAILSADAVSDQRFEMSQSIADFRIRSMMCAPLIDSDGQAFGVLQIDTMDQRSRFQQEDLDVLASVATQAAFAIDNAQLHERAIEQRSLDRDLELARKVQRGLLPVVSPKLSGYHFFDFYEAARQVGGDFYHYIPLSGGRLAVVLADVSGKGVSAALVMAKVSAEVPYCLASEETAAKAVNRINASFCNSGWDDRFVTFVLAVIDPGRNRVTMVNAGHMPPLLRRSDATVVEVSGEIAGVPLGVDADQCYEEESFDFGPGDSLSLFTDGISEAMNTTGDLYGLSRLQTQVGQLKGDVSLLGKNILDDVKRFVGNHHQNDDMCLVCIGRGA